MVWELIWRLRKREKKEPSEEEKKEMLKREGEKAKEDILIMQLREEARRITEIHDQVKNIIEEEAKKNKTVDHFNFLLEDGHYGDLIARIHLAIAIQKGLHKDPEKLYQYLIKATYEDVMRFITQLDFPEVWWKVKKRAPLQDMADPYYALKDLATVLQLSDDPKAKEYGEKLEKMLNEIKKEIHYAYKNPWKFRQLAELLGKEYFPEFWHKTPEEILGIKPEELREAEKATGARELLRLAIAEQLPGWVIKAALDQAKIPLYTTAQGVHPSIIKYHIQRADPNHPQGTLLHGLITTLLAHWEREIAAGKQPTHPHQAIQQLTGPIPGEIDEETARRIAQTLGLPTTITPQTLQETLNELLRDLKQLKEGKDPHQLDAEKEAALRYNQLRELADNQTPHPYIRRIIREGRDQILNVYNELKNQILAETQLGREEQEKVLNIIENLLKTHLDTVLNTQKPLTQAIAEITKQATETLKREGVEDPQLRSWATNLLRNILLDAPIIAAARSPSAQYLPIEEKKKIAAALLQYYQREAREHKTAPVAADLHWMWQRIIEAGKNAEDPKKSMLETIERLRSEVNAVKALGRDAYSMYKPLLSAENFVKPPKPGEEGYLTHRVITDLYNIKKHLIEGTFPRIRRIKETP